MPQESALDPRRAQLGEQIKLRIVLLPLRRCLGPCRKKAACDATRSAYRATMATGEHCIGACIAVDSRRTTMARVACAFTPAVVMLRHRQLAFCSAVLLVHSFRQSLCEPAVTRTVHGARCQLISSRQTSQTRHRRACPQGHTC